MQNRIDRLEGLVLSLMTNGAQSAGPAAAQAAIAHAQSLSGSSDQHYDIGGTLSSAMSTGAPESIQEEDGDESEMETVTKSIGVMKVHNNSTIFASEAHWYAILGEVWLSTGSHTLHQSLTFISFQR
jgi:hypothetical protein